MNKLYYVENCGCDDTTCGLVRISDEDFPKFKDFIENLNRNSTYGCMPKIYVYEIDETVIHHWTEDEDKDGKLYLDGEIYAVDRDWYWSKYGDPVIGGT